MIAFLTSRWGIALAWFLAVLALSLTLYAKGSHDGKSREVRAEAARLVKARKAVAKREETAGKISEHVAADLTKERERIVYRTVTLTKEVPTYVTPASDTRCVVPVGFVQLYNAAASGSPPGVPGSARGSVEAASGVPLSSVLETDVWNLGLAWDYRAEALSWREWYVRQAAEWAKR